MNSDNQTDSEGRDSRDEVLSLLRKSRERARGYADFFLWAADRDLEEWGVVVSLAESLDLKGDLFFSGIASRGRPNDPPDCEAKDAKGERIALEVTELVDGIAIHKYKKAVAQERPAEWADWNREKFLSLLCERLKEKDEKFSSLKGAPYPGGYVVIVHTDEPELGRNVVAEYLRNFAAKTRYVTRAFVLLSYDPAVEMCPYFEVPIGA
jgi:hypothetical protein